jgi:lysophospholipid acyltransferase
MSSVSRLSRANIRPLLLPLPSAPPSKLKRAYDIAGTITTVICMDYIAAPFMLLSIRNSLVAWRALDWYGLWIIFGGLAFFYAGGGKALKGFYLTGAEMEKRQLPSRAQMPVGGSGATPLAGTALVTPGDAGIDPVTPGFVVPLDAAVKEVEKRLR